MRSFWALPAVLRIALASPHAFSVFDDLLAFPQYEVVFPNTFITEGAASALLHPTSSATANSQETQELSKLGKQARPRADADAELQETYEAVVLDGQRYLCSIPVIPEEQPQNSTTSAEQAKAEEKKELMRAADRGWELLEGMNGSCIYYVSGWWSYSFCYNGEVRQFHQLPPSRGVPVYPPVEDPSVKSFVLGRFPKKEQESEPDEKSRKTLGVEGGKESTDDQTAKKQEKKFDDMGKEVAKLESKGSSRYMVQRLAGGTVCDLTGRDRKIEVQFHCHQQSADMISMIKETSTCSYLMLIHTPRLCNDVAFQPPQENFANPISCRPVIPESDIDIWTVRKLEEEEREAERLAALDLEFLDENPLRDIREGIKPRPKPRPVIGGIEVGAQTVVGSEGKIIEKSVIAGGGKEVFLGTIATSDGYQMPKEEMKKLGINDPAEVEKWKNIMAKKSGTDIQWKLDMIDTPRGKEFRWIIEEDKDAETGVSQNEGKGGSKISHGSGKEKSRGSVKDTSTGQEKKSGKGMKKEDEEAGAAEESQEGSEEVLYKDEL